MIKTIIKEIPIEIKRPRSKDLKLNLNIYRNLHYQTNNSMKVKYTEKIKEIFKDIDPIPQDIQVEIKYIYYHKDRRKYDISNICSIIDKFACDALISLGILCEDNITIVPKVTYCSGGILKGTSTCIIEIKEYNNKNEFSKYKKYINK